MVWVEGDSSKVMVSSGRLGVGRGDSSEVMVSSGRLGVGRGRQ